MIAQWMLATLMIGVLLTVVGHCITGFQPRLGFPRRSLWLALMLVSTGVPVGMALRGNRPSPAQQRSNVAPTCCARVDDEPQASALNTTTSDTPLLVAWGLLSLSLAAILASAHRRTTRRLRSWAPAELCGEPVLIAPNFGPAAVGVVRATVVMPEWVLGLSEHEQHLVLRHELEHIRAGDQFVLFTGVLLVVLMPWNLTLWWQLRRLRIGMELDCDARVAPTPRDRPRYADLLLHARRLQPGQQTALGFVSMHSALAERLYALLDRRQPSGMQMSAWSISAIACVATITRVPVPSVRPLFEKPAQTSATSAAPVDGRSRVNTNSARAAAPKFDSDRRSVAASPEVSSAAARSLANTSLHFDVSESRVADDGASRRFDDGTSRRVGGIASRRAVANASIRVEQMPDDVQQQTVRSSPRIRYDVLMPFDSAKLAEAAKGENCAGCGKARGARATPVSDAGAIPATTIPRATELSDPSGRALMARQIGPDSLPARN